MLTKVEFQWVSYVLPIVSKVPTSTFKFNNGKFFISQQKRKLYLQYFKMLIGVFQFLHLLTKFPVTIEERVLPHIAIHGVQLFITICIVLIELNLWLYQEEIFRYMEETFELNEYFGKMFPETQEFKSTIRERFFVLLQVGSTFVASFYVVFLLATMNFTFSLGHLLFCDLGIPFSLSFVMLTVIFAFMMLEVWGTAILHIVGFFCISSTCFWLKKSCLEWPCAGSEIPVDRSLLAYKCCYILNHTFNNAFGRCVIPGLKLSLGCLAVLCAYGIISLSSQFDLATFGTILVLPLCACSWILPGAILMSSVYDICKQFKQNLLTRIHSQQNSGRLEIAVQEKQVEACQLVRCQVGNLYHMEAVAKLTMVQKLLDALVFLLVNGKASKASI